MTVPAILDAGTVLEDFSDKTEWTLDSGLQTMNYHRRCLDDPLKWGVQTGISSSATPPDSSSPKYMTKTSGISWDLSTMDSLRLDLLNVSNYDGTSPVQKFYLDLSSTSDFSKYMRYGGLTFQAGLTDRSGIRCLMRKSDFTASGGESWSNTMTAMRIGLYLGTAAYGMTGGARLYFDKLVKDVQTQGLIMISLHCNTTADSDIFMDVLADYGYSGKGYTNQVDYNEYGNAGSNTWPQCKALSDAGLHFVVNHTSWLLHAPYDAVRPVPPYPPHDDTVPEDIQDTSYGFQLNAEDHREVLRRAKAINDFYGVPWNGDVLITHGGFTACESFREFFYSSGFKTYVDRADYSTTNNGHHFQTLPVRHSLLGWSLINTGGYGTSAVTAAIDAVAEGSGRYLNLFWEGASSWSEADLRTVVSYIHDKEDLGLVKLCSIPEFMALAWEGTASGGADILLGALNINDQVNYFVEPEGMNFGQQQTTWEEVTTYANTSNVQLNVKRGAKVPVTIPMWVTGTSVGDLNSHLETLWTELDKTTNTLDIGDQSYDIVVSTRPDTVERDNTYQNEYRAYFTLVLMREP